MLQLKQKTLSNIILLCHNAIPVLLSSLKFQVVLQPLVYVCFVFTVNTASRELEEDLTLYLQILSTIAFLRRLSCLLKLNTLSRIKAIHLHICWQWATSSGPQSCAAYFSFTGKKKRLYTDAGSTYNPFNIPNIVSVTIDKMYIKSR